MNLKQLLLLILCASGISGFSQSEKSATIGGGLTLKNNGWGIGISQQTPSKPLARKEWEFEFVTYKHAKEVNIVNPQARNPKTYVFGKLNKAGIIRVQSGFSKNITDLGKKDGLHLDASVLMGLGLVCLKPVYLDVYYPNISNDGVVIPEKYDPEKHVNQQDILGHSSGRYGWDEISFKPAVQLKTSLNLYWDDASVAQKVLKTGIVGEYFPAGMPIMALTSNPKVALSFFVSIYLRKEREL